MDRHVFQTKALRDPRLAAHAIAGRGAWLFARDGSTLLWTNATGAALFNIADLHADFTPHDDMREEIAQLAARLSQTGTARLERLYGFGAAFGQRTTCTCARLTFSNGTIGILIVAMTMDARTLPVAKRLAWLVEGIAEPVAIFDADGALTAATQTARTAIGSAASFSALGLDDARDALDEDGRAEAVTERARIRLFRLGDGAETASAAFILPFAAPIAGPQIVEPPHSTIDAGPATSEALSQDIVKVRDSVSNETSSSQGNGDKALVRPLRFVWRTDAEARFFVEIGEFSARMDASTIAALGRPWHDFATTFTLDNDRQVANALATRQTWNRIPTNWPLDQSRRVTIELSGAPIFDGNKQFAGYRGFGLCRDPDAVTQGPEPAVETMAEPVVGPPREFIPTIVSTPGNVVRFPAPAEPKGELRVPSLSPVENSAFDEIARQLAARLQPQSQGPASEVTAPASEEPAETTPTAETVSAPNAADTSLFDHLPLGILVYRIDELLYANRAFLDHAGYPDLQSLADVGGLDVLAVAADADANLTLITPRRGQEPSPVRQFALDWDGKDANALMLLPQQPAQSEPPAPVVTADDTERNDLRAVLDTTSDGIVLLGADASITTSNRSAETMFGLSADQLRGTAFADFFDAGSRHAVLEAVQSAARSTAPSQSRDVTIRRRDGGTLSVSLSLTRLPSGGLSAHMIDQSHAKATESELATARRRAETAASAKSDAIGRISHDIRTPLNAIIGFADVMIGEQFGPVGNPRYLEYLKDIRASGERVAGLIDDMGNLSRAESGKIDLSFTSIALNDVVEQCTATLQPQANRERIIIRTSLAHGLPHVTADTRTLRQVVLNLIATSIRLNHAGGQVIVSTALTDNGDVALRVRDTGAGLSAQDISAATEPHRMAANPEQGSASGAGISLALTRALVEANRARFDIRSAAQSGTLIEVIFAIQRQALAR